ncbi:MAG TPA: hypothetical protein VJ976_01545, partial [Ornithinimicrobium sp.]|uniref:hypothetical protein n=1 Tax=Ornithinimicrobium sp. TaxID=1977084 RepID=UPI002B46EDB4
MPMPTATAVTTVVVVGRHPAALPTEWPWPDGLLQADVSVWGSESLPGGGSGSPVSADSRHGVRAAPPRGLTELARSAAARARTSALAARAGVPAGYLWALKRDRSLRLSLTRADVVICADRDTERCLRSDPRLARGAWVLDRSHLAEAGASWQTLRRWKGLIDAVCEGVPVEGEGDSAPPPALPPPAGVPPAPLLRALARYLEIAGVQCVERLPRNRSPVALARLRAIQRQLGVEDTFETQALELRMWRCPLNDVDRRCERATRAALKSSDEAWRAGDRTMAF